MPMAAMLLSLHASCAVKYGYIGSVLAHKRASNMNSCHIQPSRSRPSSNTAVLMTDLLKYFPILLGKINCPNKLIGGISLIANSIGEISPSLAAYLKKKPITFQHELLSS